MFVPVANPKNADAALPAVPTFTFRLPVPAAVFRFNTPLFTLIVPTLVKLKLALDATVTVPEPFRWIAGVAIALLIVPLSVTDAPDDTFRAVCDASTTGALITC
jgi:hypothetical protein